MKMLTRRSILLAGAALAGLAVAPALAEEAAVDMAELLKPPTLGDMALGADEGAAKVTIVEYASATCPHCAAFHKDVWPKLKADYIDTKKIRFIFREFPLNPPAMGAFMVARAAPKESYFPLIGVFFDTLETWANDPYNGLLNIARQAGFTQETFDAAIKNEKIAQGIDEIRQGGVKFGVKGTPTFFINGKPYEGEITYDNMKAEIDKLL